MEDLNILFKSILNLNDTNNNYNNNNNMCLITNEKLDRNYIKLDCGHKFNYVPIFNEVVYQKKKKILDNNYLKLNEIKCPYCRKITKELLPYYKYYNVEKVRGVNFPEKFTQRTNICSFINSKNVQCKKNACITNFGIFCNDHIKYNKCEEIKIDNIDKNIYKNYKNKKKEDLKIILKEQDLKLTGNKEDLIYRILINI